MMSIHFVDRRMVHGDMVDIKAKSISKLEWGIPQESTFLTDDDYHVIFVLSSEINWICAEGDTKDANTISSGNCWKSLGFSLYLTIQPQH